MDEENVTICECCWKPIEGEQFEVDDVTMCSDCFDRIELDLTIYGGEDNAV